MAGFRLATFEVSRERLEGLMFFRVVLVTLFLGSAVAIDVEALSALSSFKNAVILGLIVATYGLTIVYAVLVRRIKRFDRLAAAQVLMDMTMAAVLVAVSGGSNSLFLFLFLVTIINSAVVLGRRAALLSATITAVALIAMALFELRTDVVSGTTTTALAYRVALNSAGAFVIAVLSGYLAERLSEATAALEEQQVDLAELKALNENILASLSSGLITVDDDGRIIYFNRAASELTGFGREEMLGASLDRVFPELGDSDDLQGERLESRFLRPDGERLHFGFSVSPLRDTNNEKSGNIIIFQDLTEIRALEKRMQRSQRLAAIGELAAGIAHEIRNPLASISGSVEMLRDDADTNEDNKVLMSIVVREVDRLDQLISDFLEYSRPRKLRLTSVPLEDTVSEVLELFRQGANAADIVLQMPEAPIPSVQIDSEGFRQVLWNLMKNGAEACVAADRQVRIQVSIQRLENEVVLAIEDDGEGIEGAAAQHIFQPFFTTKEKGTGLGLATIYRIIEEHGATIRHTSPNSLRGARFEVVFRVGSGQREVV